MQCFLQSFSHFVPGFFPSLLAISIDASARFSSHAAMVSVPSTVITTSLCLLSFATSTFNKSRADKGGIKRETLVLSIIIAFASLVRLIGPILATIRKESAVS